jgi:hypothetical protein
LDLIRRGTRYKHSLIIENASAVVTFDYSTSQARELSWGHYDFPEPDFATAKRDWTISEWRAVRREADAKIPNETDRGAFTVLALEAVNSLDNLGLRRHLYCAAIRPLQSAGDVGRERMFEELFGCFGISPSHFGN